MNMIEKLKQALCDAKTCADLCKDIEDYGTCNFDHPVLLKTDEMTAKEIEEAFNLANIRFDKEIHGMWKGCYHILGVCEGMGNKRTEMAERFADTLIEYGFSATVYYQMD